jgi:hypothetical protein
MYKTLDRAVARIEIELDSLIDDISPEDGSLTDWSSKTPDEWDTIYRDIHRATRTLAMISQAKSAELVLEVMRDLASKMGLEGEG